MISYTYKPDVEVPLLLSAPPWVNQRYEGARKVSRKSATLKGSAVA